MIDVAIAIVAYNTKRFWPRQRAALAAQTLQSFRILIVDNASDPSERLTPDELPGNAELIQSNINLGFAAANNLACARLACRYFVALNPDAFPEPDWLARLVAAAERHPRAAAIGALQVSADDETKLDGAGDAYWVGGIAYRTLHGRHRRPLPAETSTFSACAAAALYRRDAFLSVGGFDESFFCYHEDVDLGFRLRLAGWHAVQANDAIVHHVAGGASGKRSDVALRLGARNRLWTFIKNQPAALFWPLIPVHLIVTLALLARHALRGEAKPVLAGLREAFGSVPMAWRQRRPIQSSRRVPLAAIAKAMTWSPWTLLTRSASRKGAGD